MRDQNNKAESRDELARSVEFEMAAKRREWQRNRDKFRTLRVLSFSLLSLIIVGAIIGLFVIFARLNEARGEGSAVSPSSTVSPQPSPPP
jgi:F0F1-type ATP synthase assembly protein I